MKTPTMVAALLLCTGIANAEDLSKATRGLLLSSDCTEEICHAYTVQVSQKFVRLPVKRQLALVGQFCSRLDRLAQDYTEEDGTPWTIDACIFQYRGSDIAYQARDGRALLEPSYVLALTALRD